jgi:uncharacterized membrane-anchored protein YitT (DUF2179 family)
VRTAFIVTDVPEMVSRAILDQLHLGVTAWEAQGMFSKERHAILFCTISRPHARELRRVVNRVDPEAFVVLGQGHQAYGGRFGQPVSHHENARAGRSFLDRVFRRRAG